MAMSSAQPQHTAPGRRRPLAGLAAAAVMAFLPAAPADAQQLSFVRDAEIEELLRDYSRPILRAAGLGDSNVGVFVVHSRQFNAFVMDGRRIFINAGVIMQADTPNEVIGVLAHETGHIAGGHLARLRDRLRGANAMAVLATILGAGAMVAGAAGGVQGGTDIGQAVMLGGQHMAQRSLLSYQRGEEQAADRAAVNYLNATGQSGRGMLTTFGRFADQTMFTSRYVDPYAQSHPMPRERIAALEQLVQSSPHFGRTDPPALQARHDLARAKVIGFMDHPGTVERHYPRSDNSLAARYARTISLMQTGNQRAALAGVDDLIAAQPDNPYFLELTGEMLIRAGRPADAIEPLRRAVSMRPDAALIRVTYGHALASSGNRDLLPRAVQELNTALHREPDHVRGFRILAQAYGQLGRVPEAELASAQGHLAAGDFDQAKRFAQRARQGLPHGSPGWLRANDILNTDPPRT